jgi:hypothetical protein
MMSKKYLMVLLLLASVVQATVSAASAQAPSYAQLRADLDSWNPLTVLKLRVYKQNREDHKKLETSAFLAHDSVMIKYLKEVGPRTAWHHRPAVEFAKITLKNVVVPAAICYIISEIRSDDARREGFFEGKQRGFLEGKKRDDEYAEGLARARREGIAMGEERESKRAKEAMKKLTAHHKSECEGQYAIGRAEGFLVGCDRGAADERLRAQTTGSLVRPRVAGQA